MNKAIVIKTEDGYEGLYINNSLVAEGSPIEEGYPRIDVFTQLSKKYNFNLKDLKEVIGNKEFQEETSTYGSFPAIYKY